jgi:metallophosphoesterase superfamily enzyme
MRALDDWLLTPERAAVHLPSATAVVADLHLGYAVARRLGGEAVPRDALDEQLAGLGRLRDRHGVRRLVVAGDLLEDGRCLFPLLDFRDWLGRAGIELVAVVPGNHDAGLGAAAPIDGGLPLHPGGFTLGGWRVAHGDGPLPDGPVVHGHEHPWLRWAPRVRAMRPRFFGGPPGPAPVGAPCYLVGSQRLILPAFSADAAGVNVLGVRRWRSFRCCVIAGERVLDLGELASFRKRGG